MNQPVEREPFPCYVGLLLAQAFAFLLTPLAMGPLYLGGVVVPNHVSKGLGSVVMILLIAIVLPLYIDRDFLYSTLARKNAVKSSLGHNRATVRWLLWMYAILDLILLTYVVWLTGGLRGSMYSGGFLVLPAMPILLRLGYKDVKLAAKYALCCAICMFITFLFSYYSWYGFLASNHSPYYVSLLIVNTGIMLVAFIQIGVIKHEENKNNNKY